jgi:hypothetical protein
MTAVDYTREALIGLVEGVPKGTNVGLMQMMWAMVSGALQPSRGAVIPALASIGLTKEETRRAWAAFRGGVWRIEDLIKNWREYLEGLEGWEEHRHEGYKPITVDITGFYRPTLKGCPSVHYHPAAQRALPAVIMGLVGEVGEIGGQRLALPRNIERVTEIDTSEAHLKEMLLRKAKKQQAEDELIVVDAGFKVSDMQASDLEKYVIRLAKNFTARRNYLPDYSGRGRHREYGDIVRPLARTHNGKTIEATTPDEQYQGRINGKTAQIAVWRDVVLADTKVNKNNKTFDVYVVKHPDFKEPWVLATPVKFQQPVSVPAIYRDRWPVEQIPLSAKHMVGAHRQFVHAPESVQRLPELALLGGSVLSFLAATLPPTPTGFWDRHPKRTPGRLRRVLAGQPFPKVDQLPMQLRKKNSVTDHFLKGNLARQHHQDVSNPVCPA